MQEEKKKKSEKNQSKPTYRVVKVDQERLREAIRKARENEAYWSGIDSDDEEPAKAKSED